MKCLIVGQGIAGTMLAWTLLRRGAQVQVADAGFPYQSSSLAAGIINPITGKRFVKSWRFDACFPIAKHAYGTLEAELGIRVWHDQVILRLLENPQEINDWAARMATPGYSELLSDGKDAGSWTPFVASELSVGKIHSAARVDFALLLAKFRERLLENDLFVHMPVRASEMDQGAAGFDCIVFCEGYRAAGNPYFPGLDWQLSKGEALLIRIQHPLAKRIQTEMLKKTLMLVPMGNGLFWAGASYNWTFEDNGPTDAEQQFLEQRIRAMLNIPYEVIWRNGAIRPTVKDRRPYLGKSGLQQNFYIFNGLGTKGALLAPYFAGHMADHLLEGKALEPEVDIQRFR